MFGVFYKAEFDVLDDVITRYASSYEHVIFSGDFNENLLDIAKISRVNEFKDVFIKNGMSILNDSPMHFFDTGASLLDLFMTRDSQAVKRIGQIDTGMSNHGILLMSYRSPSNVIPSNQRMWRNLKSIDEQQLIIDASLQPLEEILLLADSDSISTANQQKFTYYLVG